MKVNTYIQVSHGKKRNKKEHVNTSIIMLFLDKRKNYSLFGVGFSKL